MNPVFTDSIWDRVQPHPWKYRLRAQPPTAILIHCTRGGQNYNGIVESNAAVNWFVSPNNRISQPPYQPYAGISHALTGPGRITEVVPAETHIPAWSSEASDHHALSIEVAQSNAGQPIEPPTIANTVALVRAWRDQFGIPLTRVQVITDDRSWSGIAGHEDTLQGRASGKSDPGEYFWSVFWPALIEEEPMTAQQAEILSELLLAVSAGDLEALKSFNHRGGQLTGNSIIAALAEEKQQLAEHVILPHGVNMGKPHEHTATVTLT